MKPGSRILVTGGAGSCGSYVTARLLERGYAVRVIDKDVAPLRALRSGNLTLVEAGIEDRSVLRSALEGVDAVLHLAWSFSEDPLEVLEHDLKGHLYLLEEMASRKVGHVIYASTAVVYGKPRYSPIDEDHPLVVEEARKPLYGIAKAAAEKFCLMYGRTKGPQATVLRFWWAFGDEIGGKHLREMLRTAAAGDPLEVPGDSGGSFLHMGDLAKGLELCLGYAKALGRTFNLSTVYVTWEEIAGMVRDAIGSRSSIRCIPRNEWTGSAFLADPWELSDAAARDVLGYRAMDPSKARASLKAAISACSTAVKESTARSL